MLLDYEDFLRQHGKRQWTKDEPEARAVRSVGRRHDPSDPTDYDAWLNNPDPAVVANTLICLIHQANYLLDQQIAGLERSFVNEGGYSEQLAAARVKKRSGFHPSDRSDQADKNPKLPPCPKCGKLMVLRTAKQGKNAGSQFLGCSGYPECTGTLPV